jgi:hypothetical protein
VAFGANAEVWFQVRFMPETEVAPPDTEGEIEKAAAVALEFMSWSNWMRTLAFSRTAADPFTGLVDTTRGGAETRAPGEGPWPRTTAGTEASSRARTSDPTAAPRILAMTRGLLF